MNRKCKTCTENCNGMRTISTNCGDVPFCLTGYMAARISENIFCCCFDYSEPCCCRHCFHRSERRLEAKIKSQVVSFQDSFMVRSLFGGFCREFFFRAKIRVQYRCGVGIEN